VLEQALVEAKVPYRIYGGLRFFERAEIKDTLAWLRLLNNPDDDPAFERALGQPPRGVGEKSVEKLRAMARDRGVSLMRIAADPSLRANLTGRPRNGLTEFVGIIDELRETLLNRILSEQIKAVLDHSGIRATVSALEPREAEARGENLNELMAMASSYRVPEEDREMGELAAFLSQASLDSGDSQASKHADAVQLMTLHSAKGLEFPLVFIVGMEEGLFPNQRAMDEGPQQLEEERRLAYVGMTRAEKQLVLSYAESRRWRGSAAYNAPSRFIRELPGRCVSEVRPKVQLSRPAAFGGAKTAAPLNTSPVKLGGNVRHPRFGDGVIVQAYGQGDHARVQVNFDEHGMKELVLAFSKLEFL